MNDWGRIKQFYRERETRILAAPRCRWALDPYAWESAGISMTPIERALWHDIRCAALVLYPQYPVGRFFVDYANPAAKVAIECDGAAYHMDKAKDKARDAVLKSLGWRVYRITGRDCKSISDDEAGERSQAQLFLDFIDATHRISSHWPVDGEEASGRILRAGEVMKSIDWSVD